LDILRSYIATYNDKGGQKEQYQVRRLLEKHYTVTPDAMNENLVEQP
jgi:hypothetical protein